MLGRIPTSSLRTEDLKPNRSDLDILAITTPVTRNNQVIGQLYIGMSLSSLHVQIRQTRLAILLVSLLVFIGGVIVVPGRFMMCSAKCSRRLTSTSPWWKNIS